MKPWEEQAEQMLTAKRGKKAKLTDADKAEVVRWLDGIRRTYAQKLGIDLSLGAASSAPPVDNEDPYEGFLMETDD
jgi:hypothetical protein